MMEKGGSSHWGGIGRGGASRKRVLVGGGAGWGKGGSRLVECRQGALVLARW
jgi:hypothetical protein